MKTTVIYHRSDYDGIFCREIARKFLPDAELVGWEYGDPEPSVSPEEKLYILDLSVPGLMEHPNLIWIDHHKTAIDKYSPDIEGYRIDGVAACRLAWQWFIIKKQGWALPLKESYVDRLVTEPLAVRLAGEYDIWDKRDPDAEVFQYGLRTTNLEAHWDNLLSITEIAPDGTTHPTIVGNLIWRGQIAQAYARYIDESLMKSRGFDWQWMGLFFLCVNTGRFNSLTFASAIKPEHDALLGFSYDGKKWIVSLYHAPGKEHHDLSKIAIEFGGGGHKGACGFTCDKLPFLP